jgi:hypothetical protein
MHDFIGIVFLVGVVLVYYLLMWGVTHLLVRGSEEQQLELVERRRPVVGVVYWLLTAPLLFTGWLWVSSSRWSLSAALVPAALVLLLLSGLAAGVYGRVARLRWPLLAQAMLLGLASPGVVQSLWTGQGPWLGRGEAGVLYQQYPFTVKAASRGYTDATWSLDDEPMSYYTTEFYKTIWGFDYYVGDLHLGDPPGPIGRPGQEVTGMGESFWQRVRSLHFAPDSARGRLKLSPLLADGKYNAFTDKVELPKEQVVDFWLDMSPEPQKRPK